jgi:hypothetical protein
MSGFKAIAGVSSTLKRLLEDQMEVEEEENVPVPEHIPVTIAPPDIPVPEAPGKRVNLYLYQVTENAHLKNQEIPGQGHPGAYGHPPLCLNLHYLLTAFAGNEANETADLQAQQILGNAMRVLHDFAIITPALHMNADPAQPILDLSLLDEFERIKITLEPLNLEDFSKIWTALPQANFRRSVAYQVSVVQIESRRPRRFPRLVGEPPAAGPRVHVVPFRSPQISEIRVRRPDDPPDLERTFPYARIGDTLIIRGRNFAGEATRVILGSVDATAQIADDRIEVVIPGNLELQPGAQPVQVILDVPMGEPPQPRGGFRSNLGVFMLVPRIASLSPNLGTTPRTLQIDGARLFHPELECLTLVGDTLIRSDTYTTATPTTITCDLPDSLGSGNYAVRVRVNGAESIDDMTLSIP